MSEVLAGTPATQTAARAATEAATHTTTRAATRAASHTATGTALTVLAAISVSHLLNDMLQSLMPAIYPVLKARYGLSFGQIGAITLVNQITASLLQPVIGNVTDRKAMPFSLTAGMGFSLIGLVLLGLAGSYAALLVAVAMVGIGSAIFHPESSRVARLASGGRHGFAQSIFQIGGNAGAALGPLLAAFIVAPGGQGAVLWFVLPALLGMAILAWIGQWYRTQGARRAAVMRAATEAVPAARVAFVMAILITLMLSKFFYTASMSNYYTFYLIDHFHVPVRDAQFCLFVYLAAFAAGTFIGGPVGDRIGRKRVIWVSILGVLPFSLALPYLGLTATILATIPIGLLLASAFPAIVVYAQEMMPGRVGTVAGLMFGLAFGLGGLGAALLGQLADATSIEHVYAICSFLPALGLFAAFLPTPTKA